MQLSEEAGVAFEVRHQQIVTISSIMKRKWIWPGSLPGILGPTLLNTGAIQFLTQEPRINLSLEDQVIARSITFSTPHCLAWRTAVSQSRKVCAKQAPGPIPLP